MKKIIAFTLVAVLTVVANTASAMTEAEVAKYVLDTVPGATANEAARCADKWINGGHFMVKIHDISLTCEKQHIVKDWDRPSN